eukprot:1498887-Prymnesium_polylepis.1
MRGRRALGSAKHQTTHLQGEAMHLIDRASHEIKHKGTGLPSRPPSRYAKPGVASTRNDGLAAIEWRESKEVAGTVRLIVSGNSMS